MNQGRAIAKIVFSWPRCIWLGSCSRRWQWTEWTKEGNVTRDPGMQRPIKDQYCLALNYKSANQIEARDFNLTQRVVVVCNAMLVLGENQGQYEQEIPSRCEKIYDLLLVSARPVLQHGSSKEVSWHCWGIFGTGTGCLEEIKCSSRSQWCSSKRMVGFA